MEGVRVEAGDADRIVLVARRLVGPRSRIHLRLDPRGRIEAWTCYQVGLRSVLADWYGLGAGVGVLFALDRVRRAVQLGSDD